jgi:hypothetical protein
MRLRPYRRTLVVWRQSAPSSGRHGALRRVRFRRIRRWIRVGALLTVIGLVSFARGVRPRWRPVLAGVVLTTIGVILRNGPGNVVLLPGLVLLVSAPLLPGRPDDDSMRRSELERELALYSTPAQRRDLEATLDQYPDGITHDLREILARQATAACDGRFPGRGQY